MTFDNRVENLLDRFCLNWEVIRRPLYNHEPTLGDVGVDPIENWYSFHREGHKDPLTVRTGSFKVLQNRQFMETAVGFEDASDGQLKVKRAGTWAGGGTVWCELSSDDLFNVGSRGDDAVSAYYMLVNGHDGSRAFCGSPYTHRLFCRNQLPALFSKERNLGFKVMHRSVQDHMTDVSNAISNFHTTIRDARNLFDKMAGTPAPAKEKLREWLTSQYMADYAPPAETSPSLQKYLRKTATAISSMLDTFDRESSLFGSTRWVMMNSYTKWLQHESGRISDLNRRHQRNIVGVAANASCRAAQDALQLVA